MLVVDDPQRIAELANDAVNQARQAKGIVVAAGGDGTINAVAQATLGSGCAFGVLPQGTFNYFSRTHGIPPDTEQALKIVLHESARPVQVGLVNKQVFLVNASLGLYPKLLEDREAWKQRLGRSRLTAFCAGLVTLIRGSRNLRLQMQIKNEHRDHYTPTLFVGNNPLQMEQLGLPQSTAIDNGELAGVILLPVGRLAMLGLLFRGALGQLGAAERVVDFSFDRLEVERVSPYRRRRVKVATDGEISWQTMPLVFRVSPEPLMLIHPAIGASERSD